MRTRESPGFLPCSSFITKLACIIIPGDEDTGKEACRLKYVDERILKTPPIAVNQITKEIERMGKLSKRNFEYSMQALLNKDEKLIETVEENEEVIDYLNHKITSYLVKINGLSLEDKDRVKIGSYYHIVSDMERIGDHAENICEIAAKIIEKDEVFSQKAIAEITNLKKLVDDVIDGSFRLFETQTPDIALIGIVGKTEQEIDDKTELYKDNHIERLSEGKCNATIGTLFMELLTNLERIADHGTNIAFSLYPHHKSAIKKIESVQSTSN